MRHKRNPYTPGAGKVPAFLAGRENELNDVQCVLDDLASGDGTRSVIFYGLRGVGKTVLLNQIENMCEEHEEIVCKFIEASEFGDFKALIISSFYSILLKASGKANVKDKINHALAVLKAFRIRWNPKDESFEAGLSGDIDPAIGVSDTGNFANDLLELMVATGQALNDQDLSVCLLIDEMQYLSKDELESLIGSLHRCNQKDIPICVFGAGLPKIAKDAGDAKSYAERLFLFKEIGSLHKTEASAALTEPAKDYGVSYETDAIEHVIQITDGYPYFIQEYGRQIWETIEAKEGSVIRREDVIQAEQAFFSGLDESFFKVRFDRATPTEQHFMFAMAQCSSTPCNIADVATFMEKESRSIAPYRAQLINKGLIYSTRYGEIDFTVPQFSKYLRRFRPEYFQGS